MFHTEAYCTWFAWMGQWHWGMVQIRPCFSQRVVTSITGPILQTQPNKDTKFFQAGSPSPANSTDSIDSFYICLYIYIYIYVLYIHWSKMPDPKISSWPEKAWPVDDQPMIQSDHLRDTTWLTGTVWSTPRPAPSTNPAPKNGHETCTLAAAAACSLEAGEAPRTSEPFGWLFQLSAATVGL